eukprot:16400745-Heterocapsa_arctica.AAC.1
MVDAFSQENAIYCKDLLGSLEQFAGDTMKYRKKHIDNYKPRTTGMAVIVPHSEMGKVCVQMKSVADYHMKKEKMCKNTLGCLICKAFVDTNDSQ